MVMSKIIRETDTDMFEGTVERIIKVTVLEEKYNQILKLCEQQEWNIDEGLRIVLTYGGVSGSRAPRGNGQGRPKSDCILTQLRQWITGKV